MNVLAIGDPHEPVAREGYLDFCKDMQRSWRCDTTVIMGDIVDHDAITFHAGTPDGPGASDEHRLTLNAIKPWVKAFPNAKVCVGNHDRRVLRLAESVNIPSVYLRDYADVWETPNWEWAYDFTLDDVYYFHGEGHGGLHPAYNVARQMSMSVVMGHCHSSAGVKWMANPNQRWFGMDVGCGIDDKKYAFAYGRHLKKRSILGCGVVIDGTPYWEPMPLELY